MTPWEIHAIEVQNCNCSYGCPCQFTAIPTTGSSEAAVGLKFKKVITGVFLWTDFRLV